MGSFGRYAHGAGFSLAGLAVAAIVSASGLLPFEDRVEGERAVERARYQFVLSAMRPFDEVYPRRVFEERARLLERKERALQNAFGISIDASQLAEEYVRIERSTRAPEQWETIKEALGNDRRRIEEIVCRPIVVDRVLRQKFDLDRTVHAGSHERARAARAEFLAGRTPEGASSQLLEPSEQGGGLDEMLSKAKAEASGPRVLAPPGKRATDGPLAISPALAAVLEKELRAPGDVTTVLEDRKAFQVMRLLERKGKTVRVEAVTVPKRRFEEWLDEVAPPAPSTEGTGQTQRQ
jgi:hypothetical protein